MIHVTRLNGQPMEINAELIETVEAVPHTIVTLTTRRKILVQDSVSEVVAAVITYRRLIGQTDLACIEASSAGSAKER